MLSHTALAGPGSPPWLSSVGVEPGSLCIGYGGGGAVVSGGFASTFTRPSEAWAQAVKARAQGVIPRSSALTQRGCLPKISGTHPSSDCQPLGEQQEKLSRDSLLLAGRPTRQEDSSAFFERLARLPSGTRHGEGASIRWQRTRLCAFSEVRRVICGPLGALGAGWQSTDQSMNQQLCL